MADFNYSYERLIKAEGGYTLTNHPADNGGQTYAGISRKFYPNWSGWEFVDRGEIPPSDMVRAFYRAGWWVPIQGDAIEAQDVADNLLSFCVNTSAYGRPTTGIRLAQICCEATPDGVMGPRTLAAINAMDTELFILRYAIAKLTRYRDIVTKNPSQRVFLLGWVNRVLKEVS